MESSTYLHSSWPRKTFFTLKALRKATKVRNNLLYDEICVERFYFTYKILVVAQTLVILVFKILYAVLDTHINSSKF